MNPEYLEFINKPITLLELAKTLETKFNFSIRCLLGILKKVKIGVYELKYHYADNEENINSIITSEFLSFLHELLEVEFTTANEKDSPYFKIMIKVFLDSFINYYTFMVFWFKTGLIKDKFSEFAIKYNKNQELTLDMKINWTQDFELRKTKVKFK